MCGAEDPEASALRRERSQRMRSSQNQPYSMTTAIMEMNRLCVRALP